MGSKSKSSTTYQTNNYNMQSQATASDHGININFAGANFAQDNSDHSSNGALSGLLSGNSASANLNAGTGSQGSGGPGSGSLLGINIQQLDAETVAGALDFGANSLEFAESIYNRSLDAVNDNMGIATENALDAINTSAESSRVAMENLTKDNSAQVLRIAIIGSVIIAAIILLR